MSRKFLYSAIILTLIVLVGFAYQAHHTSVASISVNDNLVTNLDVAELRAQAAAIKEKEEADNRLGQYTVNLMYKSTATIKKLSPAAMQTLTRNIVRDVNDVMGNNVTMKHFFIGAVQFESAFLRFAQSPTGPKGLSQTTRATFHGALKFCNVNDVNDDDVWDVDLSIYAGACYYKWLYLSYHDGYFLDKGGKTTDRRICPETPQQPVLQEICAGQHASIAYNQGENSTAIKSFLKNGVLSELEPAIYNSKIINNLTTTTDQKMPGVPNVGELPKPSSEMKVQNHKAHIKKTK